MNTLFECKVKYEKVQENGLNKKVTEKYLVEAISFSEAETRFTEYITPYISGEYQICGIKIAKFSEVFDKKQRLTSETYYLRCEYLLSKPQRRL